MERLYSNPQSTMDQVKHLLFWTFAEHSIDKLIQRNNGLGDTAYKSKLGRAEFRFGAESGTIRLIHVGVFGFKRDARIDFNRDELHGHVYRITALEADRQDSQNTGPPSDIARLEAGTQSFEVVEFNPVHVLTALHHAAQLQRHGQAD